MWDQKHWKWKYPHRIAELVLILVFLAMNLLFPALAFRWKLLAALAAGAVLTIPLLPLRSLIPAAFVNGLEKE